MSNDTLPDGDDAVGLDGDWIAAHLEIDGVSPSAAAFAGFVGTGQMSRNARFELTWTEGSGPSSVIVKLPSADEGTRTVSFDRDVYAKECAFYRSIAALVDVSAPRAFHVHFDADGRDFAIVLEDLVSSHQGDQFTEPSDEELGLAIAQAAALQAPVWDRTDGASFDLLRSTPDQANETAEMTTMFVEPVLERLGDGLEPELPALLQRFAAQSGDWVKQRSVPTTLVHGDFRPDNFMFGSVPTAPPLMVVDWQTLSLGLGVSDIAYLLGGALDPARRRATEADMLALYVQELAARGVDYPIDQCMTDYAIGSLHGVLIALTATILAERTERGDALFTLMLNRHGRHAIDLDALDLVQSQAG